MCSKRVVGLYLLLCALRSAAFPKLYIHKRPSVISGVSFLVFHISGTCLTLMPSTSLVVSASTM